jgi:hypothetical protein
MENSVDRALGAVDRGQCRSMVDRGPRARRASAVARRCSPVTEGEDEPVEAVLTGDEGVATRQRTGGSERRRLELVARVKEGAKELGREGMGCGEIRGSHHPFIGVGGPPERGGQGGGSNGSVNGFNAIDDGGEVKRGIKGGE